MKRFILVLTLMIILLTGCTTCGGTSGGNDNKYPNLLKVWTSYSGLLCQVPYTLIEVLWREFKNNT